MKAKSCATCGHPSNLHHYASGPCQPNEANRDGPHCDCQEFTEPINEDESAEL